MDDRQRRAAAAHNPLLKILKKLLTSPESVVYIKVMVVTISLIYTKVITNEMCVTG